MPTIHGVAIVTSTLLAGGSARVIPVQRHCVLGVRLDMFLQVLWTLEGFSAEVTFMGLQRDVDSDVGGDVITLDGGGATAAPLAGEVEVVSRFASDMSLTNMLLFPWSATSRSSLGFEVAGDEHSKLT
jgi:hypothetical protein